MRDRCRSVAVSRRQLLAAGAAAFTTISLPGWPTRPVNAQTPSPGTTPASSLNLTDDPFALGIASGDPRHDSVVLWTRLAPQPIHPNGGVPNVLVTVEWEIARDDRMLQIVAGGEEVATPALGHSVHVLARGLEPSREYWYRFRAAGYESEIGRTKTLPDPATSPAQLLIAVVCCQHYQTGYYTAYKSVVADHPDLVLFLGDYIYEYPPEFGLPRTHVGRADVPEELDDYRTRYGQYKSDPDLRAAHAAAPFVTIWDDHEVMNDYAAEIPQPADTPDFALRRSSAYQAFYEHLPMRTPGPLKSFGSLPIYQRLPFGDLAEISVLDTRQYRDDQPCDDPAAFGNRKVDESCAERHDPQRTILGETQRDWLLEGLAGSAARWNLVAQQLLFAPLDENPDPIGGEWEVDGWDGYTADRQRILDVVQDARVPNPVVLSGDIHSHVIADLKSNFDDEAAPVIGTEFVASAVSSPNFGDLEQFRVNNPHLQFTSGKNGYLRLRLSPGELHVDVQSMRNPDVEGGRFVLPESTCFTEASYVVEAGRPGAQRA